MNQEKKNKHVGAKLAIVIIIAYLLLPLVMTLIYSLFQEWVDIMPTGFTLGAYTELFSDPLFWKAVGRTVVISIIPILLCTVFVLSCDVCGGCLSSGMGQTDPDFMYDSICNSGSHPSHLCIISLQQRAGTFWKPDVYAGCNLYGSNSALCISGNP